MSHNQCTRLFPAASLWEKAGDFCVRLQFDKEEVMGQKAGAIKHQWNEDHSKIIRGGDSHENQK